MYKFFCHKNQQLSIQMRLIFFILSMLLWIQLVHAQKYELPMTCGKDKVIYHSAYSVLFNTTTNTPRWVAWTYSKSKMPKVSLSRSGNKFSPDPKLGGLSPLHDTYTNSGYDRGHLCPANECLWDGNALLQSFYMSNVCPQTSKLNRARGRKGQGSAWRVVEDKCETAWIERYETLYIVAGPIPGEIRATIPFGEGKSILVPKRFFKAIVGVRNGKYQGIGFIFTQECGFRIVSIDQVERESRLDLFYQIPVKKQNKLEKVSKFSNQEWPDIDVLYRMANQ